MSIQQSEAKEIFLQRIDQQVASLNGHKHADAHRLRLFAREQFAEKSFPGRKSEDWKYTSVRPILQGGFKELADESGPEIILPDIDSLMVSVINGIPRPPSADVVPPGVFIGTLEDAWANVSLHAVLNKVVAEMTGRDLPVFEALGLASSPSPLFIYVSANSSLDVPVHLKYITVGDDPAAVHPYTIICVDKGGALQLLESFHGESGTQYYTNTGNTFFIGANAAVEHYRMQSESYDAYHTAQTNVYQERDSRYGTYVSEFGGRLVRNNIYVTHRGENITTNIYGLFIARDKQHIDTQSFIDHAIPHCESNELYKGILLDRGHGVFNGKIIVRPDAQKTNAFQQNAALVLSEHAVMDSKPQLEIFADDVKCSHGATIGQLDEDAMFYLQSRGLNRKQASALLKRAFLKDVVDQFPSETMVDYFLRHLEQELSLIAQT